MPEYKNVEQPFLEKLGQLGWDVINQGPGFPSNPKGSKRNSFREIILEDEFKASVKKLNQYAWPGNVRELQHALERAVIMCETSVLEPDDFFFASPKKKQEEFGLENFNLEEVEKKIILKVLKQNQGNITLAAKELGLTRTSLYRRMEKYDL